MDHTTLVELQKEGGLQLLERLVEEGIDVTAAAWLKEIDSGVWYLYIATPLVTKKGDIRKAIHRINDVMSRTMAPFWFGLLSYKAIRSDSPVALALAEFNERYPRTKATDWGEDRFGNLSVDGAYIYPKPAPVAVGAK